MSLTPEQIQKAKKLLSYHHGWNRVAYEIGTTRYKLLCALRPGFREKHREETKRRWHLRNHDERKREPEKTSIFQEKYGKASGGMVRKVFVPPTAEEQRAKLAEFYHQNPIAALMNDPPPWRSALGKKMGLT